MVLVSKIIVFFVVRTINTEEKKSRKKKLLIVFVVDLALFFSISYFSYIVMGIDGAINTLARVLAPLIMGDIYRRSGLRVAFGIVSGAAFSSAIFASARRWLITRDS